MNFRIHLFLKMPNILTNYRKRIHNRLYRVIYSSSTYPHFLFELHRRHLKTLIKFILVVLLFLYFF